MLLGPIGGPILGGWLVDSVNWHWIFYINVPIGLVALLVAWWVLARDMPEPTGRFDFSGLLLLSPGLALLIYGVSNIPAAGGMGAAEVWLPVALGVVLIAGFLFRASRIENPLVDRSLFRDRTFSVAMLTMAVFAVSVFGAILLFPTYFLLVRGETALQTGLLLVPQGVGAMVTMPIGGCVADKIGAGGGPARYGSGSCRARGLHTVRAGHTVLAVAGRLVRGRAGPGLDHYADHIGTLQSLTGKKVARDSTATNIVQQTAGAVGSAVMSIILAGLLAAKLGVPTSQGQLAATAAVMNPQTHAAAADSFASTFVWALVLVAVCLIPALFLPRRPTAPPGGGRTR